jgi:hypothetical protein
MDVAIWWFNVVEFVMGFVLICVNRYGVQF